MNTGKLTDFERSVLGKLGDLTNMVEMIYDKLGLSNDKEAMDRMIQRIKIRNGTAVTESQGVREPQ